MIIIRKVLPVIGMILLTQTCMHAAPTQKEIKEAQKAYDDLFSIGFLTNKTKRLKDLEQLGAMLLVDALKEIQITEGPLQDVVSLIKTVQTSFKLVPETGVPQNVRHAYEWAVGAINGSIFDTKKFAQRYKEVLTLVTPRQIDSDLTVLDREYAKIRQTIEQKLKKNTLLPSLDEIRNRYTNKNTYPVVTVDDCPICYEKKQLIKFVPGCEKHYICIKCKRELLADCLKKNKTPTCPTCRKTE